METVLRKEGFQYIDKVTSSEEALIACEQKGYDLIVLDVTLPAMSGIEACPFIRRLTDAPRIGWAKRPFLTTCICGFKRRTAYCTP